MPEKKTEVIIKKAGGYDRLDFRESPIPSPNAGEVLLEVAAAGVNYADCVVRMGLYSSAKKYVGWPITPGFEVAGTILAVGEGVTDLAVGSRVLGITRFGGYTTHLVIPRDQAFLLPPNLSFAQAAGVPAVFLTAYYALFHLAAASKGSDILVHSAAGGVGTTLVQMAKKAGCRTVGVVGRSHKIQTVKDLGADAVIDKSSQDLWKEAETLAPHGYAAIFDANGVSTLSQSYKHLGSPGRLIIYGFHSMMPRKGGKPNWLKLAWDYIRTPRFNPLALTEENKSVMAFNLSYLFEKKELLLPAMQEILAWLQGGELQAPPVSLYPLRDVARAHQDIESGQTIGKLILLAKDSDA